MSVHLLSAAAAASRQRQPQNQVPLPLPGGDVGEINTPKQLKNNNHRPVEKEKSIKSGTNFMTRNEAVKPGAIRAQRQLNHFKRLSEIYLLLPGVFLGFFFLGGFWGLGTFYFSPELTGPGTRSFLFASRS